MQCFCANKIGQLLPWHCIRNHWAIQVVGSHYPSALSLCSKQAWNGVVWRMATVPPTCGSPLVKVGPPLDNPLRSKILVRLRKKTILKKDLWSLKIEGLLEVNMEKKNEYIHFLLFSSGKKDTAFSGLTILPGDRYSEEVQGSWRTIYKIPAWTVRLNSPIALPQIKPAQMKIRNCLVSKSILPSTRLSTKLCILRGYPCRTYCTLKTKPMQTVQSPSSFIKPSWPSLSSNHPSRQNGGRLWSTNTTLRIPPQKF